MTPLRTFCVDGSSEFTVYLGGCDCSVLCTKKAFLDAGRRVVTDFRPCAQHYFQDPDGADALLSFAARMAEKVFAEGGE